MCQRRAHIIPEDAEFVNSASVVHVACVALHVARLARYTYDERVLELMRPPDIRTLLRDDVYAAFMRRRPKLSPHLLHESLSPPWQVWVLTTTDKWRRAEFGTYDEAYGLMKRQLELDSVADLAIVCKRRLIGPPIGFEWSGNHAWCGRCRRPTLFTKKYNHRALRGHEITYDEPIRCFYCGIRQAATPRYSPR